VSLLERLRAWWLRVQARPSFQARASGFPLTRPVALKRTRQVFDLTAGFIYAQVLQALVRLEILELLLERPRTEEELARHARVPPERFRRLVEAAEYLELLRRRDGLVELGTMGAPLAGNEALRALVRHNAVFYADLTDPVALLRGEVETELSRYWPYAQDPEHGRTLDAAAVAPYSDLMARSQPALAAEVMEAYDFSHHRRLLDVGGGAGAFVQAIHRRHPHLELTLFDLPAVVEHARRRLSENGLEAQLHGGDFFRDPLPEGADVVTLVRILHDHDDGDVRALLPRIRALLPTGGRLVVAEPMSGVEGAGAVGPAYFSLYLLAMGRGRPRTPGELTRLLREAGFERVEQPRARSPLLASVLVAHAG
jgi:demethylspheroidene O-methyltransferase